MTNIIRDIAIVLLTKRTLLPMFMVITILWTTNALADSKKSLFRDNKNVEIKQQASLGNDLIFKIKGATFTGKVPDEIRSKAHYAKKTFVLQHSKTKYIEITNLGDEKDKSWFSKLPGLIKTVIIGILLILGIGAAVFGGMLGMGVISLLFAPFSEPKKLSSYYMSLGSLCIIVIAGFIYSKFFMPYEVYIDNATRMGIELEIDNDYIGVLPPRKYCTYEGRGIRPVSIVSKSGGKVIDHIVLKDPRGKFLYNINCANSYYIRDFAYSKKK